MIDPVCVSNASDRNRSKNELRNLPYISLLLVALIKNSTELTGSTQNLKEIVIGRCWDYQYMKFANRPRPVWKNCTRVWDVFHKSFAFKDPCKLKFADYEPYFEIFGDSEIINKSLFWSGTYKAVHSFSDFDDRFTTLEDTFEGSIVNGLVWCGNSNLSRQLSDGIDYQHCPPRNICDYSTSFWGLASRKFAEKASGVIRVMVNGTRMTNGHHVLAYSRQSYFGKYELPNLRVNNITELKILVVHSVGMKEIEKCNNGSIKTLTNDAERRGIKTKCFDDPDDVKHILCADHPLAKECLFYLGHRFSHPTEKLCKDSWMIVGTTFAVMTAILIVTIGMVAVWRTFGLKLPGRKLSDDQVAIT